MQSSRTLQATDTQSTAPVAVLTIIRRIVEMNVAIIVACATSLPTFFTQVRSLGGSIYDSAVSLLHISRESASKRTSGSLTEESGRSSAGGSRNENARLHNLERLKGATTGYWGTNGRGGSQELELLSTNSV